MLVCPGSSVLWAYRGKGTSSGFGDQHHRSNKREGREVQRDDFPHLFFIGSRASGP